MKEDDIEWQPHVNIRKIIAETIYEQNKLYEGLITSYSREFIIRSISDILIKYPYTFKYYYVNSENSALPYIGILFKSKDENIIKIVYDHFITSGWYPVYKITNGEKICYGLSFIDLVNEDFDKIVFRAKYDTEIEEKYWPKYLFHVTPQKRYESIKEIGLKPKSLSKQVNHESHIYLLEYNDSNIDYVNNLIIELHDDTNFSSFEKKYHQINNYVILKIDMDILKNRPFKLYYDPDFKYGYFTLNNIPKHAITIFKTIDVTTLEYKDLSDNNL